jgi:hypothetical protein
LRIGIFLSTLGGSPLQGGIERGLSQLGHTVERYRHNCPFDLVIIFNQTAHCPNYVYPDFPGNSIPLAFVDSSEYGYFSRLPDRYIDYWNGLTDKAISHDTKNYAEQKRLRDFLTGRSFPYFLREFSKYHEYPAGYYGVDYPLYYQSHCAKEPNREEYLRRPLDLYCSWGASHPWRLNLTDELRAVNVRSEIGIIEQNGHTRTPQFGPGGYFEKMESAFCCPNHDGYGSSGFRLTECLVRCTALVGPLTMRMRDPLVDGETAIFYDIQSNGTEYVSSNIVERLQWIVDNREESFEIYRNGYTHCNERWTERAVAEYLLNTVTSHDYSQPTEIV